MTDERKYEITAGSLVTTPLAEEMKAKQLEVLNATYYSFY